MTTDIDVNLEPLPGYRLLGHIGAGGYGEVWRAEAPGGLVKAIKFVYGYLSDERAARELKALNRIKQTRHPFLLSLERIEVVDGQLVIVTELADMSLKDRFQQCLDAGRQSLPRDELLNYMRDTADALDYLTEAKLQHLDIKPENILLLGGRVKVALKVAEDGRIEDIGFTGSGCAICTASASMMTESVRGKSAAEADALFRGFQRLVKGEADADLADTLGKLTVFEGVREFPVRIKCATLPWHTFHAAASGKREAVSTE